MKTRTISELEKYFTLQAYQIDLVEKDEADYIRMKKIDFNIK